MRLAPIVPVPMLHLLKDYDYHMVLTPQCDRIEAYGTFYHDANGFKILDNGVAEGSPASWKALIGWADMLNVDELIAPDVMHDMTETSDHLMRFMHYLGDTKCAGKAVMAVMQATNWSEFDCIVDIALTMRVASLALPKLLTKHMGLNARLAAAELIREKHPTIPIHCLGSSAHLHEAKDLARQGIVRGLDSSAPVVLGLEGHNIRHRYDCEASHSAIPDFWNQKPNELVEENLATYRRWCETQTSPGEVRGLFPEQ